MGLCVGCYTESVCVYIQGTGEYYTLMSSVELELVSLVYIPAEALTTNNPPVIQLS